MSSSTKIETYHNLAYCSFDFTPNYTNMINIFNKYSVNQYTANEQIFKRKIKNGHMSRQIFIA